jgi:hypothetical protein
MDGQSTRISVLGSATVIAAIISGITAVVTAMVPWLLDQREPATPTPTAQVSALAAVTSIQPTSAGPKFNLTHGVWTITQSTDDEGSDFAGSTLKFLSQHEVPGGLEATGFFEWRQNYEVIGREQVVATYDAATHRLYIQGKEVDQPERLAVGSFSAEVSEDGHRLLNGAWGNTPGYRVGVLGNWEARR